MRDGGEVQIGDEHLLDKRPAAVEHLPARPEDHRVPIEDEFILAADHVQVSHEAPVVRGARGQHFLPEPPLAHRVGRGVDVHDEVRAAQQRLHVSRPLRIPDVLADANAEGDAIQREDRVALAGLEVAVLIEDAVVGEEHLVVHAGQRAVVEHGGRVEDVVFHIHEADDGGESGGGRGDALQSTLVLLEETRLQEQVLGRIAGDSQFREGHHLHAALACLVEGSEDGLGVALEVAHPGIHLNKAYSQGVHGSPSGAGSATGYCSTPAASRQRIPSFHPQITQISQITGEMSAGRAFPLARTHGDQADRTDRADQTSRRRTMRAGDFRTGPR